MLEQPFPEAWTDILAKNVAVYSMLADEERKRLRDLVQIFIAEKHWEGAGGLELTDEIRVTIAGTGCQMLLARDHDLFARLISIIVYPSTVVLPPAPVGVFTYSRVPVQETPISGLANRVGAIVLSWDAALSGARDARDGRNTVIHELAHQIDYLDGAADGSPPLVGDARRHWTAAFTAAFAAQTARAERGEPSLLSDYAITNAAEYFAVATEMFFEKPTKLAEQLPEVYASMRDFFGLDLANRAAAGIYR